MGGLGVGGLGAGVAPLGAREILGERRGSRAKSAVLVAKMEKHNMGQKWHSLQRGHFGALRGHLSVREDVRGHRASKKTDFLAYMAAPSAEPARCWGEGGKTGR